MVNETIPPEGTEPALVRRLATILAADIAGYSRMMGENEEATVQTFRGHRAVFEALLLQHHGRVFNTAGDAILAEFPSAVEAVRCATEIQAALQTRNAHLPVAQQMRFRMGINLGDVVVQGGDLLGDGVNVAARIQTIAEPGGICLSGSVYDQIQNKLSLQFRPLGEQTFKNIRQPIRTFTITEGEGGPLPATQRLGTGKSVRVIAGGVIIAVALTVFGYWFYRDNETKRAEQGALATQLAAEKQASADARRAAEQQSRRAAEAESTIEHERVAAEAAKREAEIKAQAQAAEDARRRNEAERKRLDEERQRIEAEKKAIAAAPKATTTDDARGPNQRERRTAAALQSPPTGVAPAASARIGAGASQFDGAYHGQMCNFAGDPGKRTCWQLPLTVQNGIASASWPSRVAGNPARIEATITPEGAVKATLEGWNPRDGARIGGTMEGRVADNRIDVAGRWANGARVEGHWTRAP